jgi:hypothetical protein
MEDVTKTTNTEFPLTAKKKSMGCGKYLFGGALIFLLVGGIFFWWKFYYTYSDGSRTGMLQKLSHKGNIMKTYEGELVLSSVASTNNVALASEKFFFSVANDSLAKSMMKLEGKRVRLEYEQKNGALPWRGDSEYIITSASLELP